MRSGALPCNTVRDCHIRFLFVCRRSIICGSANGPLGSVAACIVSHFLVEKNNWATWLHGGSTAAKNAESRRASPYWSGEEWNVHLSFSRCRFSGFGSVWAIMCGNSGLRDAWLDHNLSAGSVRLHVHGCLATAGDGLIRFIRVGGGCFAD